MAGGAIITRIILTNSVKHLRRVAKMLDTFQERSKSAWIAAMKAEEPFAVKQAMNTATKIMQDLSAGFKESPFPPAAGEGGRETARSSLQRVLGLTIKGSLLSAQRVFDVWIVWLRLLEISPTWVDLFRLPQFWLFALGVITSTLLSTLTLQRHRCALRRHRPYGWTFALLVSGLQLAPLVTWRK
eukprot:g32729.t1